MSILTRLIKVLMRSGNKKGVAKVLKEHGNKITAADIKYVQNLRGKKVDAFVHPSGELVRPSKEFMIKSAPYPMKSRGTAGVKTKAPGYAQKWHDREMAAHKAIFGRPGNPRFSVEDWVKRNPLKSSDVKPWAGYKGYQPVNPLKSRIRERILQMRKNPGIASGLQRMESRKASAFNTPGTPWGGKPLRYEPTAKRNFTNMLRTDKEFEGFVLEMVGPANVAKVINNPKVRKQLMRQYTGFTPGKMVRAGADDNFRDYSDDFIEMYRNRYRKL